MAATEAELRAFVESVARMSRQGDVRDFGAIFSEYRWEEEGDLIAFGFLIDRARDLTGVRPADYVEGGQQ